MSRGCCNRYDYMYLCNKWLCEDDEKIEPSYGYIYHLTESTTNVPGQTAIPFNKTGIVKGILHDGVASPKDIIIQNTGIYEVTFHVDAGKIEVVLELQGVLLPDTKFLVGNAASITFGQAIIRVAEANSVLRVFNDGPGVPSAILSAGPGISATVFLEKIDEI